MPNLPRRWAGNLMVGMLALGMLGSGASGATTYYVNDSSGNDANAGTNQDLSKKTIQAAIDAAMDGNGDIVQVAAGTYTLTNQITIGKGVVVISASGMAATTVNGGGVTRCFNLNNASAVVDGFTITNGYNNNDWRGAGVLINAGGTLKNCIISGNILDKYDTGGGVAIISGGLVSNCVIAGNTANDGGAGVSMDAGTVRNCTISENTLFSGNGWGGGVRIAGGTLRDCVISRNSANWGVGVSCEGGTVSNCTISGNVGSGNGGGGGVRINGGTVRDCAIFGNSAMYGGGVDNNGGTVWNCTISGNGGTQQTGAGVNNNGGVFRNCLIMGNYSEASQSWGGCGSAVANGNGTMESCTIVGNLGPTYMPINPGDQQQWYSVWNQDGATMKNCMVVNNSPGFGYSGTKCTYSCTTPLAVGTGNIMQDPQFVNPGSGFGASFVAGDYRLMAYSPCINAGTNVAWMNSAKDLAGNARIINAKVDMGAYEYTAVAPTPIAAPANVAASDGVYGDKVRVTWSAVAGATGYVVYRGSDSSNVDFSASVSVMASPYNDTNTVPGTIYFYWVAAADANGRSALSASDRGYASLYGVNFDGAQVVYLDGNKHLKKIGTNGVITDVFTGTNPVLDQILFNQQGDLFMAFPQWVNNGGPGGIVLNDGFTNIVAKATPSNNIIVGVDHEIMQLSWWSEICSPNIQVDDAGNAYYFAISEQTQTGPKIKLRKYINGTTNLVDLIPGDNIQIRGWYVRPDGTVLMAGRTESTATDWFRKLSPNGNLSHIINPPVAPSFIAAFPDDMIYVGLQSWTYGGADYYWPGVYRLPPDLSNPQFSFPYIGDSNMWDQTSNQRIFSPEYDVNAVMAGHGSTWSSGFGQCKGAAIRQIATITEHGVPSQVFVTAGNWGGSKTLVQYYPTVEIIELQGIETVTLIEALGDKLVIAGSQGSNEKLILYDPSNGAEMDLLEENIEIYHLQTMYTGHIWFDGLKFTGNKYIAGQFTMEIVYNANGKASVRAPKAFTKGAYREVTLADKPSAFIGVLASSLGSAVTPDAAPSAPTGLAASQGAYSDKVQLTWRSSPGATSYEVYRNTSDNSGSATKVGTAATAGYDDTMTEADDTYYYWVKAVNTVGASAFSASASGWAKAAVTAARNMAADFDGDGKADPATVDNAGNWYVWFSQSGYQRGGPFPLMSGLPGSPVAADFDGDLKADPAMMDGSGNWDVWFSASGYAMGGPYPLGLNGTEFTPVVGDFDGDRKADPAMANASGNWIVFMSSMGYSGIYAILSASGGMPLAGDFDGDGLADPAMVAAGNWHVWFSGSGYAMGGPYPLAVSGGSPVTGDIDGDRKTDPIMVDGSGNWYVWFSASGYAMGGPYPLGAP